MGTGEFLILLAFPVVLAVPIFAVRYLGSSIVRSSGADRTIVVPIATSLPMVCAKTGTKASGLAAERSEQLSAPWFLLLLLGPAGIIALAIVWAVRGRQGTAVDIPLSDRALDAINKAATTSQILAGVAGLAIVLFAVVWAAKVAGVVQVVAGVVAIAALAGWMYTSTKARMARVRLRRADGNLLVHLDGVHPGFVTAVQKDARARGLM